MIWCNFFPSFFKAGFLGSRKPAALVISNSNDNFSQSHELTEYIYWDIVAYISTRS